MSDYVRGNFGSIQVALREFGMASNRLDWQKKARRCKRSKCERTSIPACALPRLHSDSARCRRILYPSFRTYFGLPDLGRSVTLARQHQWLKINAHLISFPIAFLEISVLFFFDITESCHIKTHCSVGKCSDPLL